MSTSAITRDVSTVMQQQLDARLVRLVFLVQLTFATETVYVTTSGADIIWNGVTYKGVGVLGNISAIAEGSDVEARGISLTLTGIPTNLLNDSMGSLQLGRTAAIYLGTVDEWGTLTDSPIPAYIGMMDQPQIELGSDTCSITIAVENRLVDLNRSRGLRYTDNQQRAKYPNDGSLKYVHMLQDMRLNPWQ